MTIQVLIFSRDGSSRMVAREVPDDYLTPQEEPATGQQPESGGHE